MSRKSTELRRKPIVSPPWPRHWYNYPMILSGVMLQIVWVTALAWDTNVVNITAIHSFLPYLHGHLAPYEDAQQEIIRWALVVILCVSGALPLIGFSFKRKLWTLLSFLPQQFVLMISAGGSIQSIVLGRFADGTIRSPAFLLGDQTVWILALFHTWAMILILLHGDDGEVIVYEVVKYEADDNTV